MGVGVGFGEAFDDDFGPGAAAGRPPETGAEAEEVFEHCWGIGFGSKTGLGLWVCWGRRKDGVFEEMKRTERRWSWVWHEIWRGIRLRRVLGVEGVLGEMGWLHLASKERVNET